MFRTRTFFDHCLLLAVLFIGFGASQISGATVVSGRNLLSDKKFQTSSDIAKLGLVVVFLSPDCPCSLSHESHLKDLSQRYSKRGFKFLGVYSASRELIAGAREHFKAVDFDFEVLSDDDFSLANRFGAMSTPHAFVIAPSGETLYAGGVSDSSDFGRSEDHYLDRALDSIQSGKLPSRRQTRALGCVIQRP
jgi:peroxiredoxin